MVVHVQYTSVASGTVMSSLRLKYVTHKAVSASLILRVAKMEAPKHWHLSRISSHSLEEGPDKQYKEAMEYD